MPANFDIDTELDAVADATGSAAGWATNVINLFRRVVGANNVFGTAATEDTGTAQGDIPVLGNGGKLPVGVMPFVTGTAQGNVPALDTAGKVSRAHVYEQFALLWEGAVQVTGSSAGTLFSLNGPISAYWAIGFTYNAWYGDGYAFQTSFLPRGVIGSSRNASLTNRSLILYPSGDSDGDERGATVWSPSGSQLRVQGEIRMYHIFGVRAPQSPT